MAPRWYVARTEPKAEFLAASELGRDGFEVFFPRVKDPRPRARRTEMPLFPGYLFLQWDPDVQRWPSFRPGHRILGWVSFGGEIPWLPDESMAALREHSANINRQGGLWRRFRAGERVQVMSGNLVGLAEVVKEAKSPQARVQVLLQFMGRLVPTHVPWEDLQPIAESGPGNRRAPRRTRGKTRWLPGFGPATSAAH